MQAHAEKWIAEKVHQRNELLMFSLHRQHEVIGVHNVTMI